MWTTCDGKENIICPNNKKFKFKETRHIRSNQYEITEEIYECEDCSNCCYKQECCPKAQNNRSIQAEGTFGIIKCDKSWLKSLFFRNFLQPSFFMFFYTEYYSFPKKKCKIWQILY